MRASDRISPWLWVPTLYFAEGLPYFIVNSISVVMFKNMGMPNGMLALYTSLLYLPWVVKPLWSPFVDIMRSKRWWILSMQILMSAAMLLLPFMLPCGDGASFAGAPLFYVTLGLFWVTAFASATHDIAADGFYMLALAPSEQAGFIGIRSTFYRLSSVFVQGALVSAAGVLETRTADVHMLLYRLPEAFLVKMMNPFLLDPVEKGGLGLSTEAVGFIYGTVGVAALTVGGILGGIAAAKWGLKKSLWPMAMSLALPCLSFVFLAAFQPESLWVTGACVVLDQFGYGFGFTAYMLYLIYFSDGEFKTAHYSLCTAFMALSMMIPGMVAGYMQEWLGYSGFFVMVMMCCFVTVLVTLLLKVEPEYGKK